MAGVRVVTDSACDLTEELAARPRHRGRPAHHPIRQRGARRPARPRPRRSSGAAAGQSPALPETAAPSPGAFRAAFERGRRRRGRRRGVHHASRSGVSATYQSALAGAEALAAASRPWSYTRSLTMGQGLLCLAAAELAAQGAALDEVVDAVEDRSPGAPGSTASWARWTTSSAAGGSAGPRPCSGSLLSIKPVIQVRDGVVEEESKQRTRARALDYLVGKCLADAPLERLAVCDGAADDVDAVVVRARRARTVHPLVVVGPRAGGRHPRRTRHHRHLLSAGARPDGRPAPRVWTGGPAH